MSELTIHKKYSINLPPERLFEAWISPETVIPPVSKIEVDPKVGGFLHLIVESPQGSSIMKGEFLTVSYPAQLVYSWEWNSDGEVTQITVDFNKLANGTELLITHSGFQSEASRDTHDSGWDSYVAGVIQKLKEA
ncbi:SRPBCC family protein [Candidatus Leptofilum sp.]|uniref:SRPBCC family protein n=1 Tax=Candidatus Leptofilum sp. TaxID=3241576 RepID=UPI003B5AFB51